MHGERFPLCGNLSSPVVWISPQKKYFTSNILGKTVHTHCGPLVVNYIKHLILGLHPANERRRYFVTTSLIGLAQA